MRKPLHTFLGLVATCFVLLSFTSCGGSDSLVHIDGTSASISKAMLNHWMQALAGLDFRSSVGTEGPAGLVSEPADYKRCASAVKLIAPKSFFGQVKTSEAEISKYCRQLQNSIKAQAMSYLISDAWVETEGAQLGLKISGAEVKRAFALTRQQQYPTEAQLRTYLKERHWTLADLLFQTKHSIFVTRLVPKFQAKVAKAGGGDQIYAKLALERYRQRIARTSCKAGYLAPGCREYHGPESVGPAPNAIFEKIVRQ